MLSLQTMFPSPMSGLATGLVPTPISRGSSLTPLDGLRPLPIDGPYNGSGLVQPPVSRAQATSSTNRPSPLAASGRMGTASSVIGGSPVQAANVSSRTTPHMHLYNAVPEDFSLASIVISSFSNHRKLYALCIRLPSWPCINRPSLGFVSSFVTLTPLQTCKGRWG